ncbi:MAG: glycosyl transferase, group 1 [Candidatus Saccharibacteria bacterium]|nr:glycosyl transferase, group 1 [Candidatus Saccharibacteria bacterium]MDB5180418.1 glycosyl transferase, group 1 [Candidatus Saccharibacteria bacterium]
MHIAIDARIINSTTGRYVERLVTYLQEVDTENEYSILVRAKDELFWTPRNSNFTVRIADFDNYSFAEQIGFKKFLKKLNADLVHFCMPQQPVNYKGKKVTTFHDLTLIKTYNSDKNWFVFHAKQKIGKYVFKKVIEDNDELITISNFTQKELIEFSPIVADKSTVIYESSDVSQIPPKKYDLPFKKYILYVGQQSDYKNIKRLGDAHQILLAKYPDLGLVLVGRKNASALSNEKYFNDRKYHNILFTDFVDDSQLSWLYTHANAYIFPSLMEGFGLPGLEAMGYGTPVVSSNATCLPEVYGPAAYYFNPIDTSDMAEAIDQVLSDDKIRTRLSKAGFKQIKKYSWKKMAKETHAVYMRVLNATN